MLINETSLIRYLDIDEMVKCIDIYDNQNRLMIILEYMDQNSMSDIV